MQEWNSADVIFLIEKHTEQIPLYYTADQAQVIVLVLLKH